MHHQRVTAEATENTRKPTLLIDRAIVQSRSTGGDPVRISQENLQKAVEC